MHINIIQAVLLGIFACLSSVPGMGGTTIGNYTLGRPLVAGLIVGIIMGDIKSGIIVGAAIQVIYIALVTPGGTVSADVRAISYIGIPLAVVSIKGLGINPGSAEAVQLASALGAAVGTLGTVLFYATATVNLLWQHIGWKCIEKEKFKNLYFVNMGLPWISHIICSFIPTFVITISGEYMVQVIKNYLPMDGMAMKTLCTVGSLLPAVGIAILLKQVVNKPTDLITFFFGFTLAASMGVNLIGAAIIGGFFAILYYNIKLAGLKKQPALTADDEEEEI